MIELISPVMFAEVSLQTAEQKGFLQDEEYRAAMDGNMTYCWYDLVKEGMTGRFRSRSLSPGRKKEKGTLRGIISSL